MPDSIYIWIAMPGKGRPIHFIKPEPRILRVLFYTALVEFLVSWLAGMTIDMWASRITHPGLVEYRTNHVQYYVPYWVPAYFEASIWGFFVLLGSLFLLMSVVYRNRWVYLDELPGHLPGGRHVIRFLGKDEDA